MSGKLLVYNWDNLVADIFTNNQRADLSLIFTRSDTYYDERFAAIFRDSDLRAVLSTRIDEYSAIEFAFESADTERYLYGIQDNPLGGLQTDTTIFDNMLYAATDYGFVSTPVHQPYRDEPVAQSPKKRWDGLAYSLSAAHGSVALSAGDDGLFEYHIPEFSLSDRVRFDSNIQADRPRSIEPNIWQLSEHHSSYANWLFSSIYSSSYLNRGYLAAFKNRPVTHQEKRDPDDKSARQEVQIETLDFEAVDVVDDTQAEIAIPRPPRATREYERQFLRTIDSRDISDDASSAVASWGTNEKVYFATRKGMEVVRFTQRYVDEPHRAFQHVARVQLDQGSAVTRGGAAVFGTVLETTDERLIVLQTDGDVHHVGGPVTRWRTYPRSRRYENHLHVILEDRLEIYAYTHDYFIDQAEKTLGIRYQPRRSWRGY